MIVRDGKVLLVKRAREPLKGKWSLPGGLIELGETAREAVAREVAEETGLEVTSATLLESVDRILRDADGKVEYHYVLLDYLCATAPGEPRAQSDAAEVAWATEGEAEEYGLGETALGVIRNGLRRAREGKD